MDINEILTDNQKWERRWNIRRKLRFSEVLMRIWTRHGMQFLGGWTLDICLIYTDVPAVPLERCMGLRLGNYHTTPGFSSSAPQLHGLCHPEE